MKKLILIWLSLSAAIAGAADFKKFCFDVLSNIQTSVSRKPRAPFNPKTFVGLFPLVALKPHPDDHRALLGHGFFSMGIIGITLPSIGTIRIRIIPNENHLIKEVDAVIRMSEQFVRETVHSQYKVEISGSSEIIYVNLETKYGQQANDTFLEKFSEFAKSNH